MPDPKDSDRYRVFCDGKSVGIVSVKLREDDEVWGIIEFDEEIKSRWGFKANRIATALEAFSNYVRVRDEEGGESQSQKMMMAIDQVEQGEIGHYLFIAPWHVYDESRELQFVNLIAYLDDGRIGWTWIEEKAPANTTKDSFSLFSSERNLMAYRLVIQGVGRHVFGGGPRHRGTTPSGSDISLHHFLTIDLADLKSPFHYCLDSIRYLPLYYPLAYGYGGAEIQYEVVSDDEIRIVWMRDTSYGKIEVVSELPQSNAEIVALTYEEFRIRLFEQHPSQPELDATDQNIWKRLGGNYNVMFGGHSHRQHGRIYCKNPSCSESEVDLEFITAIPPIPIDGTTEFWGDYDNIGLDFCFGLCPSCRTIIAFNRCD